MADMVHVTLWENVVGLIIFFWVIIVCILGDFYLKLNWYMMNSSF